MKMSKKTWILGAITLAFTIFIFSNSLKNVNESLADSNGVIGFLTPLLNFLEQIFGPADWSLIVRKGGHLTEFCILGILLHSLIRCLKGDTGKTLFGFGFFYALMTGVTDEFIQSFTPGRGSMVSDVLIDFTGAIIGFGLVALFLRFRRRKSL